MPAAVGTPDRVPLDVRDRPAASVPVKLQVYGGCPPDAAQPYSATLTATGGRAPLSWTAAPGALPPGLTLSGEGVLSGTLTSEGPAFTVTVSDANGRKASRELSLFIASRDFELKTQRLADGRVGDPYSATLAASGGHPPYTWSFTGTLAAGLSLTSNGTLSGVP
ncbi:MAG: hypothetical protein EOO72_05210, partial [Myxococcaceae bacterium]